MIHDGYINHTVPSAPAGGTAQRGGSGSVFFLAMPARPHVKHLRKGNSCGERGCGSGEVASHPGDDRAGDQDGEGGTRGREGEEPEKDWVSAELIGGEIAFERAGVVLALDVVRGCEVPARLLARAQSDREDVEQDQSLAAQRRGAHTRGTLQGHQPGVLKNHPQRCHRLLRLLRL